MFSQSSNGFIALLMLKRPRATVLEFVELLLVGDKKRWPSLRDLIGVVRAHLIEWSKVLRCGRGCGVHGATADGLTISRPLRAEEESSGLRVFAHAGIVEHRDGTDDIRLGLRCARRWACTLWGRRLNVTHAGPTCRHKRTVASEAGDVHLGNLFDGHIVFGEGLCDDGAGFLFVRRAIFFILIAFEPHPATVCRPSMRLFHGAQRITPGRSMSGGTIPLMPALFLSPTLPQQTDARGPKQDRNQNSDHDASDEHQVGLARACRYRDPVHRGAFFDHFKGFRPWLVLDGRESMDTGELVYLISSKARRWTAALQPWVGSSLKGRRSLSVDHRKEKLCWRKTLGVGYERVLKTLGFPEQILSLYSLGE